MNRCSYQCYDNETCDPFFGNCSRCAEGYKNAKCDESKFLIASLFCLKKKNYEGYRGKQCDEGYCGNNKKGFLQVIFFINYRMQCRNLWRALFLPMWRMS